MASISGPSSITINSLPATWTASGFSDPETIEWSYTGSGDASSSGNTFTITRISNADATFTISAKQGSTSASKTVTVTKVDIPVTSFTPSSSSVSIYNGSYTTVSYTYSPSNATSGTMPSLTSGGKYCSVSVSSGSIRITGTSVGSETLTFANSDGISFSISVTIKSEESSTTEVTSMSISPSSLTIQEGGTGTFRVTVSPSTATDLSVTASISSTATGYISIVSQTRSGAVTTITVKGLSPKVGAAIVIKANGGSIASQSVSVTVTKEQIYVSDFNLPDSPKYITSSSNLSFKVTALPTNADNRSWSYSVESGAEYATINRLSSPANTMSITPKSDGTVKLRFTADDAGGYSETLTIIIDSTILVTDIYVNYQGGVGEEHNIVTMDVPEGKYEDIWSNVRPTNATNPALTITNLGGTGEATMETIGGAETLLKHRIAGVKMGTVRFRLSTNDGSGVSYTFTVNVIERINDDFPCDVVQYHTVYPYHDVEYIALRHKSITIDGTSYKVHAGYVDSPLNLRGLYIPAGGNNYTTVPSYDNARSLTTGIGLEGMHDGLAREFWIYVTNKEGKTVGNCITVEREGDYVKALRFDANAPPGETVEGTVPDPIIYDGTGDSRQYIFKIPESDLSVEGYVFVGWRKYNDNTPCDVYNAGEKITVKGGDIDITLYAEWFPIPEKATGSGTVDDPFVWIVSDSDLPLIVPNKGDYPIRYVGTFSASVPAGMKFTMDGVDHPTIQSEYLNSGELVISGKPEKSFDNFHFVQIGTRGYQIDFNLTVYLVDPDDPDNPNPPIITPGEKAVVQFDPNGGTVEISRVETVVGKSLVLPSAEYVGKVLRGWYTEQSGGNYVGTSGDRYVVTKSIVLYAQWKVAPTTSGECYLTASHDGLVETTYFDIVESIEDIVTSNLSSVSTVVFGASNRYVMDLGNSRKFNVNIARNNPADYNDSSVDQRDWSNGKWIREFLNMIDFWQNFGRDFETGENTGGFRFHFEPPSDASELYPVIDKNVFIVGSVSPSYSGPQLVKMTLPLQVAGMKVRSGGEPNGKIIYSGGRSGMKNVEQKFVIGATVSILSMPPEWGEYQYSSSLARWNGSDGKVYYPGDIARVSSGTTLSAEWDDPEYTISDTDGSTTMDFDGRVTIYAVGGGGAGASSGSYAILVGGGGGAGRTRIQTLRLSEGTKISWTIGAGGAGSSSASDGEDGEDTIVSIDGFEAIRAEGGKGGKRPKDKPYGGPSSGMGGTGWGSGGTTNIPKYTDEDGQVVVDSTMDAKGGDGEVLSPNLATNAGRGQYGGIMKGEVGDTAFMGGSGGGASGFRVTFPGLAYSSVGGNGGYIVDTYENVISPKDGKNGGGGGSGPKSPGGAGGRGIVVILKFRRS